MKGNLGVEVYVHLLIPGVCICAVFCDVGPRVLGVGLRVIKHNAGSGASSSIAWIDECHVVDNIRWNRDVTIVSPGCAEEIRTAIEKCPIQELHSAIRPRAK